MANVTPADVENITLNFTVPVELSMDIIAAVNIDTVLQTTNL